MLVGVFAYNKCDDGNIRYKMMLLAIPSDLGLCEIMPDFVYYVHSKSR